MNPAEKEEAERAVKKRVMGTMRLISELYKKDMVRDWIVTTCLESLLAKGKTAAVEDSIEVRGARAGTHTCRQARWAGGACTAAVAGTY